MVKSVSGNKCGHQYAFRGNFAIQLGASNLVWDVENLTLSFFPGIQKEGQTSNLNVSAIVLFFWKLLSLEVRREVGKSQCNVFAVAMDTLQFKEVYTQKFQRNGPNWKRTQRMKPGRRPLKLCNYFSESYTCPTSLRWRQQLLQTNCYPKILQSKNISVP